MKFNVEGRSCHVIFYRKTERKKGKDLIVYVCRVIDGDFIGEGFAHQSPKDNNVKKVGRKIALARALSDCGIDKPGRTELWKQYGEQCQLV